MGVPRLGIIVYAYPRLRIIVSGGPRLEIIVRGVLGWGLSCLGVPG